MAEDREDQKQPALTDEEMRKLLKPIPCEEDVLKILTSSYVTEAGNARVVCQLDSYDDCNYKVEIGSEPFLLKIHNGVESTDFLSVFEASGGDYYKPGHAGSVIHFQNAIAETLTLHHIPTSVPVKPLNSASPVSVHTLPVLSEKHSPTQLVVRLLSWVPGRPMSEIRLLPLEVLANAGRTLGKVDAALDNMVPDSPLTLYHRAEYNQYHAKNGDTPSDEHLHDTSLMVAARRYHVWDGKHTEDLKKFVYCIKDDNRRAMVDSVIAAFTREKVKGVSFRTGIIQGDFNDANILVDHDWHVSGVIDFGDSVERLVTVRLVDCCSSY
jgi:Ser/Thr protein kinase RdoA (MazF antagonist)